MTNTERPPHAVLYTRVSTQRQVDEGHSLETQDELLHVRAKRAGWIVDKLFSDEGVSGRQLALRFQMQEALAYAEDHLQAGDYFAVYNISRLARNTLEGLLVIKKLRAKGIIFCDLEREYHDNSTDNWLLNNFLAVAQFQSDENRVRSRVGMERSQRSGRFQGRAPFGYRNSKNKSLPSLIAVREEAEVVRDVFERITRGETQTKVALHLAADSVFHQKMKTSSLESNRKSVRRMIESRVYAGNHVSWTTGEIMRGDWEALVSLKLFDRANEMLDGPNAVNHPGHQPHPDLYPLKQVLLCPRGGDKFTAYRAKGKYPYYQCKCKDCSRRERIPVSEAHEQFESLLSSTQEMLYLFDKTVLLVKAQAKIEIDDFYIRRSNLRKRYKTLEEMRKKYLDAYVMEKIGKIDFDSQAQPLLAEMTLLDQEISSIPIIGEAFIDKAVEELRALLSDPLAFWQATPDELRPELALVLFPERVICENKTLRTGNLLGISTSLAVYDDTTTQMAPPTGFEPVPPP